MIELAWATIAQGGWTMLFIIFQSIAAWTMVLRLWWRTSRDRYQLPSTAPTLIAGGALPCRDQPQIVDSTSDALDEADPPNEAVRNYLHRVVCTEESELERELGLISALATTLPLLGLLGTVTGISQSFVAMSYDATNTLVEDGLSRALLTTQAGLFIGLTVLAARAALVPRCQRYLRHVRSLMMPSNPGMTASLSRGIGFQPVETR